MADLRCNQSGNQSWGFFQPSGKGYTQDAFGGWDIGTGSHWSEGFRPLIGTYLFLKKQFSMQAEASARFWRMDGFVQLLTLGNISIKKLFKKTSLGKKVTGLSLSRVLTVHS